MFISSCFNRSFIANADSENNKQQIIAALGFPTDALDVVRLVHAHKFPDCRPHPPCTHKLLRHVIKIIPYYYMNNVQNVIKQSG